MLQAPVRPRPILLIIFPQRTQATTISLSGSSAKTSGDGASVSGSTVTISEAGTYVVSGTSENVQIVVKAGNSDKVQIVLNGVTMSGTDAAILVENAGKTSLTLADGSQKHNLRLIKSQ